MNISGRIRYFLLLGLLCWHQTVQSLEPFTESTSLWSHEQYQPVFFDFNQDKTLDLLLQAKSGSETSLFILGQPDSDTTFSPHNSLKLPTQIAGLDWSVSEAQLLPLRIKANGETGLIVIFPQRKAAAMFRFDGKNLDFSRPIAKYQSSQWPFLANVAGHELHVADFDRDGVDEILQLDKLSGEHQILNLQSNFSVLKTQTIKPKVAWGSHGQSRIIIRDFDNNGFADIVALAKRPDAKHYLILADQYGKFSHAEPQELSSNFDGLSWFDNGSGTLVVKRRSDQRPVLLRLFSEHEQSQASAQNCVGWLYDPLSKTSQEYCLKAVSSANSPKQASNPIASNFESTEIVLTNALNECPIIEFSVSASGVSEVMPDNQCPSMPQRPTAAPILEGSSFQVNQTFRMQLMNTRDPNALTYEAMATLNGDDYVEIASTIAAANDVYPSITVSGRLSVAGHYQVRYRSCNHQGCSGFGPASALQIVAAPVSFLVSTNAETGGSISPTSTSVIQGSSTSFTVTPLNGFSINTVTGCGGNLSGNTYTTGAINSVCTVRATFEATPVYHTVTATSDGNGSISPASRLVEHGNSTSFTVTPHSGFRINTVTGCGGNLSGNTYTTGAITDACSVRATFVADPVYHTVTATSDGNGSISPASRLVEHGSSTSFTVTPASGFRINTVTGCGGNLSGNTYTTAVITGVCTVRATFVVNPVYHTVTATSDGNGSISPASRLVEHGSSTSFTVTPHSGYRINTVTGCGGNLSGTTYTTAAITSACSVRATFEATPVYHTVTARSEGNGSISPASRSVEHGSSTSFTVTPASGYQINSVNGCNGGLSGTTFVTGPINAPCNVTASFKVNSVAIQVIYLHTDALGSVIAETDANGNVIKRSEYKPFGEVKDN